MPQAPRAAEHMSRVCLQCVRVRSCVHGAVRVRLLFVSDGCCLAAGAELAAKKEKRKRSLD